jgi:hypothetical protein
VRLLLPAGEPASVVLQHDFYIHFLTVVAPTPLPNPLPFREREMH